MAMTDPDILKLFSIRRFFNYLKSGGTVSVVQPNIRMVLSKKIHFWFAFYILASDKTYDEWYTTEDIGYII